MAKKFTKLEQIGVIAMVGVAGLFFYLKLIYDPLVEKYGAYKKKCTGLTKEVDDIKSSERNARGDESLKKSLKILEKDLKDSEQSLARTDTQARATMAQFFEIAENNQLTITGCNEPGGDEIKSISKNGPYKRKYYGVLLAGDYKGLLLTLKDIGMLPQLITIERLEIGKSGGEGAMLRISLLLSI